MAAHVLHGDCRTVIASMAEASVDAIVTDPPYQLGFMGRSWDASGVTYDVGLWREALRVLKPGGHLLAFGGNRTHHRLMCAIEDAGFEVRDCIMWLYGSGFPKGMDVGKAIDKAAGVEPRRVGSNPLASRQPGQQGTVAHGDRKPNLYLTAPATPEGEQWDGWGTALKPSYEPIVVARKPLAGSVAQNVLAYGTGALNIDGCRIEGRWKPKGLQTGLAKKYFTEGDAPLIDKSPHDGGRWPSNLVLSHSPECGEECAPDCPVAEMDRQSGNRPTGDVKPHKDRDSSFIYGNGKGRRFSSGMRTGIYQGDTGGASRFFPVFRYEAKASSRERALPDGTRSPHPTVKPLALMRWLVRLVTPPDGVVLDMFAGSGTTLVAAVEEGFEAIGIEQDAEYCAIIEKRLAGVQPRLALDEAGRL